MHGLPSIHVSHFGVLQKLIKWRLILHLFFPHAFSMNDVKQRASTRKLSESNFEEVWKMCLRTISKTCQSLRLGKVNKNTLKL